MDQLVLSLEVRLKGSVFVFISGIIVAVVESEVFKAAHIFEVDEMPEEKDLEEFGEDELEVLIDRVDGYVCTRNCKNVSNSVF